MSKKLLIITLFLYRTAYSEELKFIDSTQALLGQNIELINDCRRLMPGYKNCSIRESNVTPDGTFYVEPIFRYSAQTQIKISREFHGTGGDFRLLINDIQQPIPDGSGEVTFNFNTDPNGKYKISIVCSSLGRVDLESDTQATITNVSLVKDNTYYVNVVLVSLGKLQADIAEKAKLYKLQKDFNHYFSLSEAQIRALKEVLTGRAADDYSCDCNVDGKGNSAPLDPDECQILRVFNDYLAGKPTGIGAQEKKDSFEALYNATNTLGNAIEFLKQAKAAYDKIYQEAYEKAFQIITSDKKS